MTPAVETRICQLGEFYEFEGGGRPFLYLVPAGAIFELDEQAARVIERLRRGPMERSRLIEDCGFEAAEDVVGELEFLRAIRGEETAPDPVENPPDGFPLQTLVLNLTNQCNLSCQYCYEFGEDKVATPEGKPKFMDFETAKASVDFLLEQSPGRRGVHLTFFGGETLMNFPLLQRVVSYATEAAAARAKTIDFSLTTNATLLTPAIIRFLSENRIGVTVSMDGPPELHDQLRVFANGRGSYDVIAPRVRQLIDAHRTRPIAARVTLTAGVSDVIRIYRHLKQDLGFHEVGFAPVTTAANRLYAINDQGMNGVFEQFRILADEWLEFALRGELHGFSNVSDTIAELYQGVNKSHPCGAGLGLIGVGPSGDIAPCHRFVDSDTHSLGHVSSGIDREKQSDFLSRGHIGAKYACHTCWARPLCAGGCHHEAFVRYGDTGHPNLHYCDWIRGWTGICLRIFGTLVVQNPEFLEKFAERKSL
ncbi:MAG: quinohemoprotein amine dehydrogenase maturation protein [Acidobacteriia bacterium]|nr:quinohemoprotein amine dehydrogenase maturation protein [Terriglobia bacterium]